METHLAGHTGLFPPLAIVGPLLGRLEPDIGQGEFTVRDVAQADVDLAVVKLAQPARSKTDDEKAFPILRLAATMPLSELLQTRSLRQTRIIAAIHPP
jgi:hypothetical protein